MKKIFRVVFTFIIMIFFILIAGSIILDEFPAVQPVWSEAKEIGGDLYHSSIVEYGSIGTIVLIIGFAILIGSSRI